MIKKKKSPYLKIVISFLLVILLGTILLMLPYATPDGNGLSFIDSLFTSTSAICVTGLSVVPNVGEGLTLFGKIVLMLLIEIGGLGFLTIAVFVLAVIGKKIGITDRFLMREALNQNSSSGIVKLVKYIILTTITIQSIGAVINFCVLIQYYDFIDTVGISIFHSVSSFCNAGFDIFGYDNSMINFSHNIILNLNTMFLIIFGGIGFIVIIDVIKNKKWKKYMIHTKIVLMSTGILILLGGVITKLTMWDEMSWLQAFFHSVSTRTAGFATYPMSNLSVPAYIITLALMLIGASPASTGGGIKTTSFFVLVMTLCFSAVGKKPVAFNRRISEESIFKAFSLLALVTIFIFFITFSISVVETNFGTITELKDIVFETVSAFGTVGLSTGITPDLHSVSKFLICVTMFTGRLGPLTLLSLWNKNWQQNKSEIKYIEEKIIIG